VKRKPRKGCGTCFKKERSSEIKGKLHRGGIVISQNIFQLDIGRKEIESYETNT
jgi:hypothetical protein